MKRNVWYAMFLGLAIQTFCIGVALLIRETRDLSMSTRAIPAAGAEEAEPCIGEEEDGEVESIRSAKLDYMDHFRNMMGSLRQHWDVVLLVLTFLISSIGRSSLSVFLQYVSKRYGWILANVSTHPFLVPVSFHKTNCEVAPQGKLPCLIPCRHEPRPPCRRLANDQHHACQSCWHGRCEEGSCHRPHKHHAHG